LINAKRLAEMEGELHVAQVVLAGDPASHSPQAMPLASGIGYHARCRCGWIGRLYRD
jgi:hypothetical protein